MISAIADNWIQTPGPGASDGHYFQTPLSSRMTVNIVSLSGVWTPDASREKREDTSLAWGPENIYKNYPQPGPENRNKTENGHVEPFYSARVICSAVSTHNKYPVSLYRCMRFVSGSYLIHNAQDTAGPPLVKLLSNIHIIVILRPRSRQGICVCVINNDILSRVRNIIGKTSTQWRIRG